MVLEPSNEVKVKDKRAISISQLYAKKFRVMDFKDNWQLSFGRPELSGSWIIYGPPKNGKTRLAVQLAKYLTSFARVAYDSLEEGFSESIREAFETEQMEEVSRRIVLLDKEPVDNLMKRLLKRRSPDVAIIDSLQYTGMTYQEYRDLKDSLRNKLLIFISHAEGKEPAGRVARSVRYDANITIRVEGFKAFVNSRYGNTEPFTIWTEGASKYWNR